MSRTWKRIVFIVLGVFVVCSVGGYIAWNLYVTDAGILKERWNLTLPADAQKTYKVSSYGALGDGSGYLVYQLKENNPSFLGQLSSEKNMQLEKSVTQLLAGLKADTKRYPDFSQEY